VFAVAAVSVASWLRPDPLRLARSLRGATEQVAPRRRSVRWVLRRVRRTPDALLGLAAIAVGHAVMVSVMSMTPVHLHHGGATLEVIGLVISLHIAGMYAASPVVGFAADRYGRRPVIVAGAVLLLVALAVCASAGPQAVTRLGVGLTVLGLGFSCTLIAGSTLLTEATPPDARPAVQGTADLVMGSAGATAGLLAGVAVGYGSYRLLVSAAAFLVLPLAVASLRRVRVNLHG
jgi:MFS family permease